jgi:hypothetical protein
MAMKLDIIDVKTINDEGYGFANCIHSVDFVASKSDENGNTAKIESKVILPLPDMSAGTFIDIESVTKEQTMIWLDSALGEENKAGIEARLNIMLQNTTQPKPQTPVKPSWLQ